MFGLEICANCSRTKNNHDNSICEEFKNAVDDNDLHREDLEFIEKLKTASMNELLIMKLNLSSGAPEWQIIAVDRAINKRNKNEWN